MFDKDSRKMILSGIRYEEQGPVNGWLVDNILDWI